METLKDRLFEYTYNNLGNLREAFKNGFEFAEKIIYVEDELPSIKNGYVNEEVLVFVKNKNKEDGIILPDVPSFDGESWSERNLTWERIIGWRPIFYRK